MHFEGEFRVPGTPSEVIRRFEDVPRMASCMPGAVLETQAEDGSWPGKMIVAFGPKKVAFKGKVNCAFDEEAHTGTLHGRGTADMRSARIGVKVSFALHPDPAAAAPTTIVKIVSDAELGGVLADFARAGGVAVANVIMADFARRASAEFSRDVPAASSALPASEVSPSSEIPRVSALEAGSASATSADAAGAGPASAGLPADGAVVQADAGPAGRPVAPANAQPDVVMASDAAAGPSPPAPSLAARSANPALSRPEPAALSATGLLWAVLKAQFVRLAQRLGLRARDA